MMNRWNLFGRLAAGLVLAIALIAARPSPAQEAPAAQESSSAASETVATTPPPATPLPIDKADTAFLLICAALVMLMTPGLGLFYGGMVRRKNVLATFQQSFIVLGTLAVQWVAIGYTLSFAPDTLGGFIGNLDWFALKGVGVDPHPTYANTVPQLLHMVYQGMFAIITPALISGAFAERMKFSAYVAFTLLWATLVYDPVAHWVWGGGWIATKLGALDYAGGLVVHIISGVAALCCVLVMGKRKGLGEEEMHPHNLTLTAIGTGLLWFGWFGFNAGSALAANKSAVVAFVNTNTAAAAATVTWALIEWIHKGKATVLGACTGAVAGLVAITPAAGYVTPAGALTIGTGVCFVCYTAILLKGKLGYDDSLDVFGVHGVGGMFGAIAVGLLGTASMIAVAGVPGDVKGLIEGSTTLLTAQALSVLAAFAYSFVATFVILKVLDLTMGLRVTADEEEAGLDLTQHGERGYIMGVGELLGGQMAGHPRAGEESFAPDRRVGVHA